MDDQLHYKNLDQQCVQTSKCKSLKGQVLESVLERKKKLALEHLCYEIQELKSPLTGSLLSVSKPLEGAFIPSRDARISQEGSRVEDGSSWIDPDYYRLLLNTVRLKVAQQLSPTLGLWTRPQ